MANLSQNPQNPQNPNKPSGLQTMATIVARAIKELRPNKLVSPTNTNDPATIEFKQHAKSLSYQCDILAIKRDLEELERKIDQMLEAKKKKPTINFEVS